MRICFIGPANSAHIKKWCNWFISRKHEVHVISFTPGNIENVYIHYLNIGVDALGNDVQKLKYIFSGYKIKRLCDEIHPDVINVHYATSYGTAVALSGIKKYVLSIWGSDIYEFPQKSFLHRALLKFSLNQATYLFSTSISMAKEANKYTRKKIEITPFGVDMNLFTPKNRDRQHDDNFFLIGTVKTMSDTYGIADILRATQLLVKEHPSMNLRVRIAGEGPKEDDYRELASNLEIHKNVQFLGLITQKQASVEWANMDVAVLPSVNESFGVAAIEAQASGVPVVVTNVSGLLETTEPGRSSIVVNVHDPRAISDAVYYLYTNREKWKEMGYRAREFVASKYELNDCFNKIENLFQIFMNDNEVQV